MIGRSDYARPKLQISLGNLAKSSRPARSDRKKQTIFTHKEGQKRGFATAPRLARKYYIKRFQPRETRERQRDDGHDPGGRPMIQLARRPAATAR